MAKTKHGMSKTSIYSCWQQMIQRCENPKHPSYKYYGGRGITVCERWYSFENFYADVGDRPKGKSLDRWPDNDGNYELNNWRWASCHEQNSNTRPASCGPAKQRWFFAFNENTGEWKENNNQSEFARRHKLSQGNIPECLRGRRLQHKGWTFQWIPL